MRTIWLVNPYGPILGEGWRAYRFHLLGEALAKAGYNVVWWTSSFSHHFKKQRTDGWEDRILSENFTLRLVPSPSYNRNIGIGRVWRDLVFGWRTYRRGCQMSPPSLVIFYESPFCFGLAGYFLGRYHRAKMIFDQVDLWPEVVETALPRTLCFLLYPLLFATYYTRAKIYSRLDASFALATPYLEAMHMAAPVLRQRPSCVAYNGIDVRCFRAAMRTEVAHWSYINKPEGEVWAVFAGSLGETYDIRAILSAGALLESDRAAIRIFIAGDGPLRGEVAGFASKSCGVVSYLGKLTPAALAGFYSRCDIGLCAYSARSNVEMPDKIYDYTAAGLAVVNSLEGEVASVVSLNCIGLQYDAGDARGLATRLEGIACDKQRLKEMRRRSFELGAVFDCNVQVAKVATLVDLVMTR